MVVSLALSLAISEAMIRLLTPFPIHGFANRVPDPILGYRLSPGLGDVDANGFRNPPSDETRFDIIAIGDSHTQGFGVAREEAWPFVLGDELGRSVYNLGVGGYGFLHYRELLARAAAMEPRYVVVGLFLANDIRPGVCATVPPAYYARLLAEGFVHTPCTAPARRESGFVERLSERVALISILRRSAQLVRLRSADLIRLPGTALSRERVRLSAWATDIDDQEVRANFEASLKMLADAAATLAEHGTTLTVLLIPSEYVVLTTWAKQEDFGLPPEFSAANEVELMRLYSDRLRAAGIPVRDATPYVVAAYAKSVDEGETFYPLDDGHPLAAGQRSYAAAAVDLLSSPGGDS